MVDNLMMCSGYLPLLHNKSMAVNWPQPTTEPKPQFSWINWWYNIVARKLNLDHVRLVFENKAQQITIHGLTRSVSDLQSKLQKQCDINVHLIDERDKSIPSAPCEWVERAQVTAAKQRVSELEQAIRTLQEKRTAPMQGMISGQLELLRKALHNEKAYTLFLEDCLLCLNPSDVFNTLSLEKRQEYFNKAQ